MNYKDKLISQLEALKHTMLRAAKANAKLNMSTWVEKRPTNPENSHWCGTAACICGYQAIAGDLDVFDITNYNRIHYEKISDKIAESLEVNFLRFLGGEYLYLSIIEGTCGHDEGASIRLYNARSSELFTEEELNHAHLTTKSSPKDATDYLQLCIDKLRGIT